MNKLTIAFSAIALGVLVGCGSDPVTPAPAPVVITPPPTVVTTPAPAATPAPAPTVVVLSSAVRPGFGRIESISAVPPSSAAAGGTTLRRLGIKMEDGSMQHVDTAAGNIALGDRVELTSDGKIRH
ncbi:MAG TPA: hypothetical protein VGT43_00510 [Burkholderiales bacterium]|nr:hypothetical protein [Burkholderiales bacterium]